LYDLVVRNGMVLDGSGRRGYRADVAVHDGRIAEIGRIAARGHDDVDAEGHVVTPGFIDGHTHMDAQVMWDPWGSSSCWHGVTTVVMGNCGFTLAPVRTGAEALVVRNLERAEDISADAMAAGIDWTWESFAEYLDAVDARPKAINYAAYVGHSALRTWAMGERAFTVAAGDDDVSAMCDELRRALAAGAVGFSTSRSNHHQTSDDRPVASRLASWSELHRLVATMGEHPWGVFEIAQEGAARSPDPAEQDEFFARMRALAVDTGVPITFGVVSTTRSGHDWRGQLRSIDETTAAGGTMFGQSHSRGVTSVSSFRTRLPFDVVPEWAELRALPLREQRNRLRDAMVRARLVEAAHRGSYRAHIGAEAPAPDYDRLQVLTRPLPPNASVAELAAARGVDPVELIIDLGLESDFAQLFVQPMSDSDPEDNLTIMRHPRTVMTFSDAGAHVSQIIDASIQTHLLAYWVRERQEFTLEEAVHMVTARPAAAWGFVDRGVVREGMAADLNVIDPATVGPALPTVEHDLPSGAPRLKQKSTGILATVVNGRVALHHGDHTGALSGRLVRGPFATSQVASGASR
jgi:N-acyl-D-aspartate/D-glutamate deacylase